MAKQATNGTGATVLRIMGALNKVDVSEQITDRAWMFFEQGLKKHSDIRLALGHVYTSAIEDIERTRRRRTKAAPKPAPQPTPSQ